jgi:hypothetical protein
MQSVKLHNPSIFNSPEFFITFITAPSPVDDYYIIENVFPFKFTVPAPLFTLIILYPVILTFSALDLLIERIPLCKSTNPLLIVNPLVIVIVIVEF